MAQAKWKKYWSKRSDGWVLNLVHTSKDNFGCMVTGFGKTKNEALYEVLDRVAELANTNVPVNGESCYLHCRIGRHS